MYNPNLPTQSKIANKKVETNGTTKPNQNSQKTPSHIYRMGKEVKIAKPIQSSRKTNLG